MAINGEKFLEMEFCCLQRFTNIYLRTTSIRRKEGYVMSLQEENESTLGKGNISGKECELA